MHIGSGVKDQSPVVEVGREPYQSVIRTTR
jgi:hypothetical protein